MRTMTLLFYRLLRYLKHWQLFHDCAVYINFPCETRYFARGHKQCDDCGKVYPLFELEIKHQR